MSVIQRLCVLISALCVAAAAPARAEHLGHAPMWRLTSPSGAQITLLGSIHSLTDAKHWRSPEFDRALRQADEIWTEIPTIGVHQFGHPDLLLKGMLPPDRRLDQILSPELYHRVETIQARNRWPRGASLLPHMRPWLVDMAIESNAANASPAANSHGKEGMDYQIPASAPSRVRRHSLETVDELTLTMMNQSEADQIKSLEEAVDQVEREAQDPDREAELVAAYASGDLPSIVADVSSAMQVLGPVRYQRDVIDRNVKFTRKIERLAKTRKKVLVVVGLGHLVGPDSIPALLTRDGFRVSVL